MNPTNTTQKEKNRAGFGRQGAVFQNDITATAMHRKSVSLPRRARQALELLLQAQDRGLTQRVTLELDTSFWRLAAAVGVLRKRGFLIHTHRVHQPNGRWHARYELLGMVEGAHHG